MDIVAHEKWLAKAFGLELDDREHEPDVQNQFAEFGDFQLVGHGEIANEYCAQFISLKGCLRVDLHNRITLDGKDYRNEVFVRRMRKWCHKPTCPLCYKSGWANREARRMVRRLMEGSKKFGMAEHIVCSVPVRDYHLDFHTLRRKAVKVLKGRGILGGGTIFHAFRYDDYRHWYWSPHFHVLGYVKGGFAKCRMCSKKDRFRCYTCDGMKGRQVKGYEKDQWIVKVLGERITLHGTAWYQLNHSSLMKGVKNFRIVSWFGVVSYRKMKLGKEERKEDTCPLCGHDLINIRYHGSRMIYDWDVTKDRRDSWEKYTEDGQVVFDERPKKQYRY